MKSSDILLDIEALTHGKAACNISHYGIIRMIGNEAVDFLQRISTNDFSKFSALSILPTLLITEKGRMVDRVIVLQKNGVVILITSPKAAQAVIAWLNKFIIMEDLLLEDRTGTIPAWMTFENSVSSILLDNDEDYFIKNGYRVISNESFEYYRISIGLPAYQKELTESYNPLELNLWKDISFTKGCYVGQEVIARIDAQKKIQRRLCCFQSEVLLDPNVQYIVTADNEDVGKITSNCEEIRSTNNSIGLVIVKNKYALVGTELFIKDSTNKITITKIFEAAI